MSEIDERLLAEVRQIQSILDEVKHELCMYGDIHKLSTKGAIANLIRRAKAVDEIRALLKTASKHPDRAVDVLAKIEATLDSLV